MDQLTKELAEAINETQPGFKPGMRDYAIEVLREAVEEAPPEAERVCNGRRRKAGAVESVGVGDSVDCRWVLPDADICAGRSVYYGPWRTGGYNRISGRVDAGIGGKSLKRQGKLMESVSELIGRQTLRFLMLALSRCLTEYEG